MYDRGVGVVTLVIGGALLVGTIRLPEAMLGDPAGPRLLPMILAWVLLALGALLTIRPGPAGPAAAGGAAGGPADSVAARLGDPAVPSGHAPTRLWGGGWRLAAASALLFAYAFLLTPLGYLVATTVVLVALLVIYNPGRLVVNVVVAVGFTLVTWGIFHKALGVYMPRGLLG